MSTESKHESSHVSGYSPSRPNAESLGGVGLMKAELMILDMIEARLVNTKPYISLTSDLETALLQFERAQEWADLISCLQHVLAVLENKKYASISLIPRQRIAQLSKSLGLCLSGGLPSGVHITALTVYGALFAKLTPDMLARDLALLASSLFNLQQHASETVKPLVLDLLAKYILPLGRRISASLPGLLLALLPGYVNLPFIDNRKDVHSYLQYDLFYISSNHPCAYLLIFLSVVWKKKGRASISVAMICLIICKIYLMSLTY